MLKCGCVDNLGFLEAPLCTLNMISNRSCVEDIDREFSPNVQCDCPNECVKKDYIMEITQLEWPTNKSISRFVNTIEESLNNGSAAEFLRMIIEKYLDDKLQGY